MADSLPNYRKERVERLLRELEYELSRGVMEGEIEEEMHWRLSFPFSRSIPNGHIVLEFSMRPHPAFSFAPGPRLKLVGKDGRGESSGF